MCEATTMAIATIALAGTQIYAAERQASSQKKAMEQSKNLAEQQAKRSEDMLAAQARGKRTPAERMYGSSTSNTNITGGVSATSGPTAQIAKTSLLGA